jgi:AmpD protein
VDAGLAGRRVLTAVEDWLPAARRAPSPNWDERPRGTTVDLLVLHGISLPPGVFGGPWIEALFENRLDPRADPYFQGIASLRVSPHLLIHRDGELVQCVDLRKRAWHAGVSRFQGRESCNDFSIGIELEGTDDIPYDNAQYRTLASVCRGLMARFPDITPSRIVGHSDVAPGRKTDPGPAFDWGYLRRLLAAQAPPSQTL